MKYETEFRIKEKEFRPRKKFKHDRVIEELANIVKEADNHIEDMNSEVKLLEINNNRLVNKLLEEKNYTNKLARTITLSTIINIGLIFTLLVTR